MAIKSYWRVHTINIGNPT